ncbi:hypothetical protein EDC40_1172 [Aminobacter aminovorans]|uniref:Uncharacterized protein n=1 Tax=Aminobacter aminovorans TaxID=83263 RepID=A0A381IJ15_AMIAI|nr:hypothetical protein EDC40_1172 [Aminobacter aminovorans]SUY28226.1 Uncharacterised protein [Aminobacter aminovorans]
MLLAKSWIMLGLTNRALKTSRLLPLPKCTASRF